ncbi:UPF0175 family protein [Leptolyngbya sp. NIES-2104]|uniref:UPF0175 family protein n=1 Tax=Leptolyngbya sp. NIES-2104 TaxID=1552121 RepID=UPI0006EC8E3C|nr:UPF0175 family protein [Leptolyngbya sp. NIES-2104]GAP97762.1 hypothetical protein NIES2104_43100 [Leptolyngbya sp. NIES-2104]
MQVTINIPDDFAETLQRNGDDLSRKALEALVIEAYRNDIITRFQVRQILGLRSRFAVDTFLKQSNVYLHYDESDLEDDRQTLERLRQQV